MQRLSLNEAQGEIEGKTAWRLKGNIRIKSTQIRWFLWYVVRRGGWINWTMAKGNSRGAIRLKTTQIYGSRDGQAGRLDCVSSGQKMLKKILKQVPKSGRLYSPLTHNTCKALHVPGSSYLDLVGLWLLVRKWGPILPHPVRDAPRGSLLI